MLGDTKRSERDEQNMEQWRGEGNDVSICKDWINIANEY